MQSFETQLIATDNRPSGFDYLRIVLSVSVIAWHGLVVCYGRSAETPFWMGFLRPLPMFMVPSFFALSGFLVAGSLERNDVASFLTLRALRIFPALFIVVVFSALVLGPVLTTLPLAEYFRSPMLYAYFRNILAQIRFTLPGVFPGVPAGPSVNLQLWTVPLELKCYLGIVAISLVGLYRRPLGLFPILIAACFSFFTYQVVYSRFTPADSGPPGWMVIACFLFGASLYTLRDRIPRHFGIFVISFGLVWIFLLFRQTIYLAPLPMAYVTVYLGLLNPPRTKAILGADYSYGVYLYGFPVQQTISYVFPGSRIWAVNVLASLFVSGCCAFLSWHLIEAKVMSRRKAALGLVGVLTRPITEFQTRIREKL